MSNFPSYVVVIFDENFGLESVQGPFMTKEKAEFYEENCDYSNCLVKRVERPDE